MSSVLSHACDINNTGVIVGTRGPPQLGRTVVAITSSFAVIAEALTPLEGCSSSRATPSVVNCVTST